jgi:hypothetical protein
MESRGGTPYFQPGSGQGSRHICTVRGKSPLGIENGLLEPRPQAHPPDGIYIARALVQDRWEVPVRVFNATHRDQKLTRGSPVAL